MINKKKVAYCSPFIIITFFLLGCVFSGLYVQNKLGLGINFNFIMFDLIKVKIKNAIVLQGVAIWGLFILIPLFFLMILLFTKKTFYLHGNASIITDMELNKSNLLKKGTKHPDLFIGRVATGRYKGKLIRSSSNTPVSLVAGTREGKGISFVIPNLITYTDSCVCLDSKGELYERTAGYRQLTGQEVFLFSPDGYYFDPESLNKGTVYSDVWNVLDTVRNNPLFLVSDLTKIALNFFPFKADEIWNDSAVNLFVTLGSYVFDRYNNHGEEVKNENFYPSISLMMGFQSKDGGFKGYFEEILKDSERGAIILSDYTLKGLQQYLSYPEKIAQSIVITFNSALNMFNNPLCAKATSGKSSFNLNECRKRKITIYFVINPNNMGAYKRLINLFFASLIEQNMDFLPEQNPDYKYQLLVLLDEFATLGEISVISESITHISGYNIRLALIYQDVNQLEDKDSYGKNKTNTILSSCEVEINFPPISVNEEAERLSKSLGNITYKQNDRSRSSGKSGGSTTKSIRLEKRALYLPQEIVELGKEVYFLSKKNKGIKKFFEKKIKTEIGIKQIIFKKRTSPIICDKIIYFDDPFFSERVNYSKNQFNLMIEQSLNNKEIHGIKMPRLIESE